MIKLPKQVKEVIKVLTDKGYAAYAAGLCVRDSLLGNKPTEWDVTTSAGLDVLKEQFPEAKVLSEKYGIIRLTSEEGDEEYTVDVAAFRKASAQGDAVFTDDVHEDLERRDFTVNALADNGAQFVDDFGGRSDIQAKLVRTVGDAGELFRNDPLRMLKAFRITAELGFDLTKDVYEAIMANHTLIRDLPADKLRREFMAIIGSEHSGKALNMLVDMDVLADIIGEEVAHNLSSREKSDLMIICNNVDKTKPVPERRMGVFLSILSEKKGMKVIDRLGFEGMQRLHMEDVVKDLAAFHFAQQPQIYKKFMYEHAPMERSDYLLNLQKALLIIFDYSIETKIKSKMYMLSEMDKFSEPIFIEDLAIDANDLMEAGILDTPEECDKMLHMLIERLHIEPKKNTRNELFKLAKVYKKNKLKAYFRGISWIH